MAAGVFLVLGLVCVVSGVAHWSPAAALVILGLAFMAAGWELLA